MWVKIVSEFNFNTMHDAISSDRKKLMSFYCDHKLLNREWISIKSFYWFDADEYVSDGIVCGFSMFIRTTLQFPRETKET